MEHKDILATLCSLFTHFDVGVLYGFHALKTLISDKFRMSSNVY